MDPPAGNSTSRLFSSGWTASVPSATGSSALEEKLTAALARVESQLHAMQAQLQRTEASAYATQQLSETRWNWLVYIIVSELLPRCQDFRYFFESIVPALMAGVNPFYPAGPPTPQPVRQLEVLARPQYNLDDVAEYLWSHYCTLPSWQRPLDETAPVFHTA